MEDNNNILWFCVEAYRPSGRPKLEVELAGYVRELVIYSLVVEGDFDALLRLIIDKQEKLHQENKRLKKVEVKVSKSDDPYFHDSGNKWLYIGMHSFHFKKVIRTCKFD